MAEQALLLLLKTAGNIGHPAMVAGFALIIASVFVLALRGKRPLVAWIVATAIIVLGVTPFAASTFLHSRGVYHVQIVVVGPDQTLVDLAQVKSSNGGHPQIVDGGWELDIPQQARPADGKVTLSAYVKDDFLKGGTTLVLAEDYYPTATIQLAAETADKIRGVVVDEDLGAVAGATVSIEGYAEIAVTDQKGSFVLPVRAAKGQVIAIHAQKDQMTGHLEAPAGKPVEVIMSRE